MSRISATGRITWPVQGLATLIAHSQTFQGLVDADDWSEAVERVYLEAAAEDEIARPCARVMVGEWQSESVQSNADGFDFMTTHQMGLVFEFLVPDEYAESHWNATVWMCDTVDAILQEMELLAGTEGNVIVRRMKLVYGPARADAAERRQHGDLMQMAFSVDGP